MDSEKTRRKSATAFQQRLKMQPKAELQSQCKVFLGTDTQEQMDWHHKENA